jgi:dTDP-4-amino-4,6-dideoxygalactose transaminase
MAAILLDIKPGDEVIAPSYTFVSTVNAFSLRGAKLYLLIAILTIQMLIQTQYVL